MYFRFPLILLFLLVCLVAFVLLQSRFERYIPEAKGMPSHGAADLQLAREEALLTIRATDLRAHLEFLADDLLEGRDTGSHGAAVAAKYIASHFERNGLAPVGDGETYFQSVPLKLKKILPMSLLEIEIGGEMVPLRYGKDFLVTGVASESGQDISAVAVFAGFGITAEEYDYDDYKDIDVQGKVAVVVSGEPASDDEAFFKGKQRTRQSSARTKRTRAREEGAVAVIGIMREEQLDHFSWPALRKYFTKAQVKLVTEDESPQNFPSVVLHPEAARLVFAGSPMDYEEIDTKAKEGHTQAFALNKRVRIKIHFEDGDLAEKNVVGFLAGSDPQLKSEVVIFSAHYDHVGIGAAVKGDSIYNGAADNASGTSGLLELAEAFASLSERPRRSMLFLGLTAEEKGLLGSEYYVEHPLFPLEKTVANFNLDMIGIGDTTALVVYGIERSTLGDYVRKAAAEFGLEIWPDDMPEQRIFYRSDHYNFARKGVPAILPSFGVKRSNFSDFTKFYHQPSDDANLPWLNYNYMQKHVRVVFQAAWWVANADDAPQWAPGDEFGKIRAKQIDEEKLRTDE
ncbi:MAG: M28 family peptidase [Caldithrix sp.]|nr:MAG: M28 family peptidase [Caldithrix sp.]